MELGGRGLKLLNSRLVAITMVVPEPALAKLRSITIELDLDYGGLNSMQYHPGADWLRDAEARCASTAPDECPARSHPFGGGGGI